VDKAKPTRPPLAAAARDWMARTDVEGDALRLTVLSLLQFAGGLEKGATSVTVSHASFPKLAEIIGCSERTVRRRLKRLRELGYVSRTDRRHLHLPNVYTLISTGHLCGQSKDASNPYQDDIKSLPEDVSTGQIDISTGQKGRSDRTPTCPHRPDTYVADKGLMGFLKGKDLKVSENPPSLLRKGSQSQPLSPDERLARARRKLEMNVGLLDRAVQQGDEDQAAAIQVFVEKAERELAALEKEAVV